MYLRKAFKGLPSRSNVEPQEQGVPNSPKVKPQGEVTNVNVIDAIRMLSQSVTNKIGQQRGSWKDVTNRY